MDAHDRNIDGLEEGGVRSTEGPYGKSLNVEDDGPSFCTSATVVVMIQKVRGYLYLYLYI